MSSLFDECDSCLTLAIQTKEKEYSLTIQHDEIDDWDGGIFFFPPTYIINRDTKTMEDFIGNLSNLYPKNYIEQIKNNDISSISFSDVTEMVITEQIGADNDILWDFNDTYDMNGYAVGNARKIQIHYHAFDGLWKVDKYYRSDYYWENEELIINRDSDWIRMNTESDEGLSTYRHDCYWTVCQHAGEGTLTVNADPDGNNHIIKRWYPKRIVNQIETEYQPGGEETLYVIGRMTFRIHDGRIDFDDCEYTNEGYASKRDCVVDEKGYLVGFLVNENIVLWIRDFEEGGRCYKDNGEHGDYGLILNEYTDLDFEDNEIQLVEFGFLTHTRW